MLTESGFNSSCVEPGSHCAVKRRGDGTELGHTVTSWEEADRERRFTNVE